MSRAERQTLRAARRAARKDRRRTLVTPEGIALPIVLAGLGTRLGALLIDLAVIVLIMLLGSIAVGLGIAGLNEAVGGKLQNAKGGAASALEFLAILWIAALFLLRHAYFLFFELGPRGATPGKRLTGIRIAARGGGRLSAEMVLARNLLRDVELFLPLALAIAAPFQPEPGDFLVNALAMGWFALFALLPASMPTGSAPGT